MNLFKQEKQNAILKLQLKNLNGYDLYKLIPNQPNDTTKHQITPDKQQPSSK